ALSSRASDSAGARSPRQPTASRDGGARSRGCAAGDLDSISAHRCAERIAITRLRSAVKQRSIHNVIPAVDVDRVPGDKPRRIEGQERRRGADVIYADQGLSRRFLLRFVEQLIELRDP